LKKPLNDSDEDTDELDEKLKGYANKSVKFKENLHKKMIFACEN
jgi:hypothetical protein